MRTAALPQSHSLNLCEASFRQSCGHYGCSLCPGLRLAKRLFVKRRMTVEIDQPYRCLPALALVFMLLLAAACVGCAEGPTGPTAAEIEAQKKAATEAQAQKPSANCASWRKRDARE